MSSTANHFNPARREQETKQQTGEDGEWFVIAGIAQRDAGAGLDRQCVNALLRDVEGDGHRE